VKGGTLQIRDLEKFRSLHIFAEISSSLMRITHQKEDNYMKKTLLTVGITVLITLSIVIFAIGCYAHEFVTVTTNTKVTVEVPETQVTTTWKHLEYNF
jgi:hypothetical protein